MTTNKPEIVAWFKPASDATLNSVDAVITDRSMKSRPEVATMGFKEPLVRLSDYEALQAECEKLRNDLMDALRAAREFIRNQRPQTTKLPDGRVRLEEDLRPAMRILWKIDAALEGCTEKKGGGKR